MQVMSYKGFNAKIMKAKRLTGDGVHELPSGTPIDILPVDVFKEPLPHWIKGAGNYVVPVDSDWGLWFDWTGNDSMNTAVLLSVKGMNPVTGQRTNGFSLERYEDLCPVHGDKFKDGLFCEKCNYRWPNQNYIAYPNTLWWDGFRSSDGKVRQFFFTEDMARSIPELVIGKEDTVPAFGFAFFRPKITREFKNFTRGLIYNTSSFTEKVIQGNGNMGLGCSSPMQTYYSSPVCCDSIIQERFVNYCSSSTSSFGEVKCSGSVKSNNFQQRMLRKRDTQEVGVGAGAEIFQDLKIDSLKVSDWENEPSSIMRLYFVFIEQFEEIKLKGLIDLTGVKEGYLDGLLVG